MTGDGSASPVPPAAADPAPTRDIEVSTVVAAPAEAVWRALTEGDQIASWFAPSASAQPGRGGHLTVSWGAGAEWTSSITGWEPERHLRLVDQPADGASEEAASMALDYHLTQLDGATRLDVVNSGLSAAPEWDDTFHMMRNGWRFFAWNLKHFLERHPTARRTMISERPWVSGTRERVWDRVFGEAGIGGAGDPFRFALDGGEALEGTVVLCDRPWAFAGVVSSLNDGVLHVEMEGSGDRWKMGVWLSAYGVEQERCEEIGGALAQTVARLFPEQE